MKTKKITKSKPKSANPVQNDKCRAMHFGPWMIEQDWFVNAVDSVKSGVITAMDPHEDDDEHEKKHEPYDLIDRVAVIRIEGPMMKAKSKFGGTSTVDTRAAIREAVLDDRASSILLLIDSPGGTVAGTDALAQDVADADQSKPVYAHIEDMCASAAYYIASQARRITANKTALIGSLGAMMVIVDSSAAASMEGLKVIPLTTGGMKAAGAGGTPITDEQQKYFQGLVDSGGAHFMDAVKRGRKMTTEGVESLFDGRVHDAEIARSLGLIDSVESVDSAMQVILLEIKTMTEEMATTYLAEHPEAVAGYIEQGKKAGRTEARSAEIDRMKAISAACGKRSDLAIETFIAGREAEDVAITVKALDAEAVNNKAAIDAKEAEAKAESDKLATAQAELAKVQQQVAFLSTGQRALAVNADPSLAVPADSGDPKIDAKKQAESEWDTNAESRKGFSTKERYVAVRIAQLTGKLKMSA